MGEIRQGLTDEQGTIIRPTFNGALRVEGRQERLTGDAGAILLRDLIERIDLIDWLDERLDDPRDPALLTHPLPELLRTQLTLLALGWTDADHADLLRHDPALRLAVSARKQDAALRAPKTSTTANGLASQPTLSRLLATLAEPDNRPVLEEANLFCAQQRCRWVEKRQRHGQLTLDVDSLPIKVHGHQAGAAYNGHFHQRCYHPLIFGSADTHKLYGAVLREGQVYTADGLIDAITRYLDWTETYLADEITVRGDAGMPSDALLTALEQRPRLTTYIFRFTQYAPLERMTRDLVSQYQEDLREKSDQVREEEFRCHELSYQGEKWRHPRRVVLVLVPPEQGELSPRSFFLITNFSATPMPGALLVDLYRERGTYEDMLGQLKSTLAPQLSSTIRCKTHYRGRKPRQRYASCDAFAANQALLSLNLLAYNLLSLTARLHDPGASTPGTTQDLRLLLYTHHPENRASILPEGAGSCHPARTAGVDVD